MSDTFLFLISLGITVLGFMGSYSAYQRRGLASGMRGAAWSLVPLGAYLTGFTKFASDLVLSPVKWAGIVLVGLAVTLYMVSGVMLRRGSEGEEKQVRGGRKAKRKKTSGSAEIEPAGRQPNVDPDLADIEAILRKRGIS